jgi:hypothetical protein
MKSIIAIAAGTMLSAMVALPYASAQMNDALPDERPGDGAIIDPQGDPDDTFDEMDRPEPGDPLGEMEPPTGERGRAGDAPLTDDPESFDDEGIDEPGALPGEHPGDADDMGRDAFPSIP